MVLVEAFLEDVKTVEETDDPFERIPLSLMVDSHLITKETALLLLHEHSYNVEQYDSPSTVFHTAVPELL